MKDARIRRARPRDLKAINAIYNDAVLRTIATFDTVPKTPAERRKWFASHKPRHPVLVVEREGRVVGWASLSPFSDRLAYRDTAESSIYMDHDARGEGLGRALFADLIREGKKRKFHALVARIAGDNKPSVRLHRREGFRRIGTLHQVGRKFGRLIDVHLYQKIVRRGSP